MTTDERAALAFAIAENNRRGRVPGYSGEARDSFLAGCRHIREGDLRAAEDVLSKVRNFAEINKEAYEQFDVKNTRMIQSLDWLYKLTNDELTRLRGADVEGEKT